MFQNALEPIGQFPVRKMDVKYPMSVMSASRIRVQGKILGTRWRYANRLSTEHRSPQWMYANYGLDALQLTLETKKHYAMRDSPSRLFKGNLQIRDLECINVWKSL